MKFTALSGVLDMVMTRWHVPFCAIAVRARHGLIHTDARQTERLSSVPENSLFWIYSLTKLFTSSLALQLWEEGAFRLDDPVSEYLPECRDLVVKTHNGVVPARTPLRLKHLITMTGGISYDEKSSSILALHGSGTTRDVASAIVRMPLAFNPGEHFLYGYGLDVLAAVLEIVTGESFGVLLRERILDPLGIKDAGFFPDSGAIKRFAPQYTYDFRTKRFFPVGQACIARLTDRHESGGGGLYASLDSVSLLCDALACGGEGGSGARILRENTVALMRSNALNDVQMTDFSAIGTVPPGYGYGFGVRTLTDKTASPGPVGEFGWSGAAGSWALMDPVCGVSLVYFQHALNFLPAFNTIHNALRDALYADLAGKQVL